MAITHIDRATFDAERFWRCVDRSGECWLWTGGIGRKGYGQYSVNGHSEQSHRVAYCLEIGAIPDSYEIDHVWARGCKHRHCVRPEPLEAISGRANILRSNCPPAINARKTHCIRGHAFSLINTLLQSSGRRVCRMCRRLRKLQHREKMKQQQIANGTFRVGRPRKTHCAHGHQFDEENTRFKKDGTQVCTACKQRTGQTVE